MRDGANEKTIAVKWRVTETTVERGGGGAASATERDGETASATPTIDLILIAQEGGNADDLLIFHNDTITLTLWINNDLYAQSSSAVPWSPPTPCSYEGLARGYPESYAAVNLCDGRVDGYVVLCPSTVLTVEGAERDTVLRMVGSGCVSARRHPPTLTNDDAHELRVKRASVDVGLRPLKVPSYYGDYKFPKRLYVELGMIHDTSMLKRYGSEKKVIDRAYQLVNLLNALYHPINIRYVITDIEVWEGRDVFNVTTDPDHVLSKFSLYRLQRLQARKRTDTSQLFTRVNFGGGVVGKANRASMCSDRYSTGVNQDRDNLLAVASTLAHELGHVFGLRHDNDEEDAGDGKKCSCAADQCIMAGASGSFAPPKIWSTCSLEDLKFSLEHGFDWCLKNVPPVSARNDPKRSTCGNGIWEEGEECDCGIEDVCDNKCCDASTCKLRPEAACASGDCCDRSTCELRPPKAKCRAASNPCDLAEYCDGEKEQCPADVHKHDGVACTTDTGNAFCSAGFCRTVTDGCRILWGPSGEDAGDICYTTNSQGDPHGHCGYDRATEKYKPCAKADKRCGLMFCKYIAERPEIGGPSLINSASHYIGRGLVQKACRGVLVDLGEPDPGLVPNGAPCGDGMMCQNTHCIPVGAVLNRTFPGCVAKAKCSGHGVCNANGNCHCDPGYAPPFCDVRGEGGSIDSGPPGLPAPGINVSVAVVVFLIVVIPLLTLIITVLYRRRPKCLQKFILKLTKDDSGQRGSPNHRQAVCQQKQNGTKPSSKPLEASRNRGKASFSSIRHPNGMIVSEISPPLPPQGSLPPPTTGYAASDKIHIPRFDNPPPPPPMPSFADPSSLPPPKTKQPSREPSDPRPVGAYPCSDTSNYYVHVAVPPQSSVVRAGYEDKEDRHHGGPYAIDDIKPQRPAPVPQPPAVPEPEPGPPESGPPDDPLPPPPTFAGATITDAPDTDYPPQRRAPSRPTQVKRTRTPPPLPAKKLSSDSLRTAKGGGSGGPPRVPGQPPKNTPSFRSGSGPVPAKAPKPVKGKKEVSVPEPASNKPKPGGSGAKQLYYDVLPAPSSKERGDGAPETTDNQSIAEQMDSYMRAHLRSGPAENSGGLSHSTSLSAPRTTTANNESSSSGSSSDSSPRGTVEKPLIKKKPPGLDGKGTPARAPARSASNVSVSNLKARFEPS